MHLIDLIKKLHSCLDRGLNLIFEIIFLWIYTFYSDWVLEKITHVLTRI